MNLRRFKTEENSYNLTKGLNNSKVPTDKASTPKSLHGEIILGFSSEFL